MGMAWRWRECALISHEGGLQGGSFMSLFNDREDAFEKQFAHDEELRFKATARRNKLLGLWIAERLGKAGSEAEAYARSLVQADFQELGDRDVQRRVRQDLES